MSKEDAHFVDCGINPDNPASGSNVAYPTGLSHLEGEEVQVLGDGAYLGTETVSGGAIALDDNTTTNHVGLAFTSTLKPSKLDIDSLGLNLKKKITLAIISFYNTLGGLYGVSTSKMETITFRSTGDTMDGSPDLFTGIKEVQMNGGYEREGNILVQQEQPLPMLTRGLYLDLGVYDV